MRTRRIATSFAMFSMPKMRSDQGHQHGVSIWAMDFAKLHRRNWAVDRV